MKRYNKKRRGNKKVFLLILLLILILINFPKHLIKPSMDNSKDYSSILLLVNKDNKLDKDYKPDDLTVPNVNFSPNSIEEEHFLRKEASTALEELFNAAKKENIYLYALSGYRSFSTQKAIYERTIKQQGRKHADEYVAKPGYSEHQTGLAMDVTTKDSYVVFENTPEARWLSKNAYKYGFIIRYPLGKESITGYSYESWHIRYVGKKASKEIFTKDLVLEQYLEK